MATPEARRSTLNASEFTAVFSDYDERESPYDGRALKVSLTSDVLFVYVGTLKEERGSDVFAYDDAHGVGIDAEALYEVLGTMLRRSDRNANERLREGTLPADHPSLAAVPVPTLVPGTRRRA